jgi:hypothetical protein
MDGRWSGACEGTFTAARVAAGPGPAALAATALAPAAPAGAEDGAARAAEPKSLARSEETQQKVWRRQQQEQQQQQQQEEEEEEEEEEARAASSSAVSSAPLDASTAIVAPADERVPPEMSAGQLIDADDELPAALGAPAVATDTTAADQGAAVPHGQEQEGQEEEEEQEGMETVPALPLPPPPPAVRLGSSSGGGDAGECGGEGECEAVWVGPGPLGVGFSPGGCPPIIDRIVPGSRAGAIPGLRTGLVLVAVNGERVLVGTGGHSHAEMIGMVRAAAMALESGEAKRLTMRFTTPPSAVDGSAGDGDGSRTARELELGADQGSHVTDGAGDDHDSVLRSPVTTSEAVVLDRQKLALVTPSVAGMFIAAPSHDQMAPASAASQSEWELGIGEQQHRQEALDSGRADPAPQAINTMLASEIGGPAAPTPQAEVGALMLSGDEAAAHSGLCDSPAETEPEIISVVFEDPGSIGIDFVARQNDAIRISKIVRSSQAARAQLFPGLRILEASGIRVSGLACSEAIQIIHGKCQERPVSLRFIDDHLNMEEYLALQTPPINAPDAMSGGQAELVPDRDWDTSMMHCSSDSEDSVSPIQIIDRSPDGYHSSNSEASHCTADLGNEGNEESGLAAEAEAQIQEQQQATANVQSDAAAIRFRPLRDPSLPPIVTQGEEIEEEEEEQSTGVTSHRSRVRQERSKVIKRPWACAGKICSTPPQSALPLPRPRDNENSFLVIDA